VTSEAAAPVSRRGAAAAYTVVTARRFAGVDAMSKHLSATYSPVQILWTRYVCFVVLVLLVARGGGREDWRPAQPALQITRSLVLVAEMLVFIVAVKYLPLADVHGVGALCPLLTSALAVAFLGERVTGRFVVALVVACGGALLIAGPDLLNARWEIAWALVGAVLWSVYQLLTRLVGRLESAGATTFFTPLVGLVVLTPVMPWLWTAPSAWDLTVLAVAGVIVTAGHYLLIKALEWTDASFLQPFQLTIFPWAVVFGLVAFGDRPRLMMLIGAGIVVAANVYAARVPSTDVASDARTRPGSRSRSAHREPRRP
jgi:drug/metabolite transporter (DMT)-like permease